MAEQQMVEVAKALSLDARVLIMDEPTSALTESEIDQLFSAIAGLTARGVSVIYISHRLEELARVGHRATVMRDGRQVATLPLPAPIAELVRLMVDRDVADHFPVRTGARGAELLRVERVSRGARLHDVSLTLHRGEILGVAGLLGAGRTELARVIAGADAPDTGRVVLNGRPLRGGSTGDAIRAGVGLVPEDRKRHGLILTQSVAANLSLPQLPRLCRSGVIEPLRERQLVSRWIADLRIKTSSPDAKVLTLSGGNQQKVVLGKWLAAGADVLIVDEPTRGIDVGAKMEVYQLLDQLAGARRGDPDDLVGPAGGPRHERSSPRHASGARRRHLRPQGRHAGACPARRARAALSMRRIPGRRLGTVAGLFALCLLLWILTPHFLTVSNLLNVLEQTAINAVIAAGMTFVIISAGIDLSVGSLVAVAGVALASGLNAGHPVGVAIAIALGVGSGFGLLNGVAIAWGRLPPFIATLGMMSIARGCALLYTDGRPISGFGPAFRAIATSRIAGIPAPVVITLVVYLIAHFALTRTRFGRYVYSIGGNEEATRLSGVNVRLHKTLVYGVSGLASAVAAVLLTARLNSAQPIAGIMYELDAIAATVIGGASLMGGEGGLGGTIIGALIMGVLRNGLNLLGVSSFVQQIVIGLVIVFAVLIDTALKRMPHAE